MNSNRKIVHIDMDAFFASVEQLDNQTLKGKPVIVGGRPQGRGVVAACSYEARSFGVHSAMPCYRAAKICPEAIFIRPRMSRYQEISAIIMNIFHEFTDIVEPLSVDEAFLDLTVNHLEEPSASLLAEKIREKIFQETGLTASAGVSCNKFVAKVASDINKPNGITIIPPGMVPDFLAALPITKFYGVGKATAKKMERIGVSTGGDLRRFSKEELQFHFGKTGSYFYNICRGIDNREVKTSRTRKSIGSERTLSEDTLDPEIIKEILVKLAESVSSTLANKKCYGFTLTLKIRYHDFKTITRSSTYKTPLFTLEDILFALPQLTVNNEIGSKKIRLLGISISSLVPMNSQPFQLRLPFHLH
ncbi:DNA polymerase IV [Desulfopila sp. IMCC35008]|uniref:DNA polymerase IV n=1 Tax=Desulfopila sp. IMCC35008 TaxID=2653858 RepID=UPI0013D03017|nr:DNA polymerase IV [Desulfopila sp. IMCC35008]